MAREGGGSRDSRRRRPARAACLLPLPPSLPNRSEIGQAPPCRDRCHRGGYGLIQWTSIGRYNALGSFCNKYDCNPSTLEGQTRFMINETTFQRHLPIFEGGGLTVSQYMIPAYYWLGWGIKGNREHYSYNYSKKLILT